MPAIKLKRKTDAAGAPASLVDGEIAVNQSEGVLYGKRGSDVVRFTQASGGATYLDRTPEDETVTVIYSMPADVTVTKIITDLSAGSLTLQPKFDDGSANNIGSTISVTSTEATTTLGTPVDVDAGDKLQLTITSTSTSPAAADLGVQIVWTYR